MWLERLSHATVPRIDLIVLREVVAGVVGVEEVSERVVELDEVEARFEKGNRTGRCVFRELQDENPVGEEVFYDQGLVFVAENRFGLNGAVVEPGERAVGPGWNGCVRRGHLISNWQS